MNRYDVVIAGAGPAGCAAAMVLREDGLQVAMVGSHERTKHIGESLPGGTLRLLRRLSISGMGHLMEGCDYKACLANASAWGSEAWTYQDGLRNPEGGGWHVDRARFDAALRTKAIAAGALLYDTLISRAERRAAEQDYMLQLKNGKELQAKWVVDATGRNAWLAKRMGWRRERLGNQMSVVCWMKAADGDTDGITRTKSVTEGWWYTALLPNGVRVAALQSLPATVALLVKTPSLFFDAFNRAGLIMPTMNSDQLINIKAVEAGVAKTLPVAQDGMVCVGDAALSLDPLSSQGIFFALYSGVKGAEAIVQSEANPHSKTGVLEQYSVAVEKVFEAHQRTAHWLYSSEGRYRSEAYWKERGESRMMK